MPITTPPFDVPSSFEAAVLGKENLRSTVARTLAEKREAQRQAEGVSVKRGDIENIRATLPFLLPQHILLLLRHTIRIGG